MGTHEAQKAILTVHVLGLKFGIFEPVVIIWAGTLLILLFFLLAFRVKKIRTIAEMLVGFAQEQFMSTFPHYTKFWVIFFISLFVFIATNNLIGEFPGLKSTIPLMESPSSNINFTFSLAIAIFFISMGISIRRRGWKYLKQFFPSDVPKFLWPIIGPLEMISYMMRPFSLALRLFANMFAGHMIMLVFFTLLAMIPLFLGKFVPFLVIILIKLFELFICLIQAFIFTFLSASYISDAMSTDH